MGQTNCQPADYILCGPRIDDADVNARAARLADDLRDTARVLETAKPLALLGLLERLANIETTLTELLYVEGGR